MFDWIFIFLGVLIVGLLVALIVMSHKANTKLFTDINKNNVPDELEAMYKDGMDRANALIKHLQDKLHMSVPVRAPATPPANPVPAVANAPTPAPPVETAPAPVLVDTPSAWLLREHPEAAVLADPWGLYCAKNSVSNPAAFPTLWAEFLSVSTKV